MKGDMKSFVVILISLHLAFAKEAFEITQGLEEDPGEECDLRLLQVRLSLQRFDISGRQNETGTTVVPVLQNHVSTTLPQLQIRYQNVLPEDLAWTAEQLHGPKDALRDVVASEVTLSNALGVATPGESPGGGVPLKRPEHSAEWIQFSDEDPRKGYVKGHIQVGPALNETDVTHYNIFWASNSSTIELIVALPKGIYEHQLASEINDQLGVRIPPGANQLVVKTSNAAGTMDGPGTATSVFDFWRPPLHQLLKGLLRG